MFINAYLSQSAKAIRESKFCEFCGITGKAEGEPLQFFLHLPEFPADGDSLGTVLFAFAAANAVSGIGFLLAKGGTHHIFFHSGEPIVDIFFIIAPKTNRNVNPAGTGHTIAASGTGNTYGFM